MSQMSLVEKRARQTFAISLLNRLRHALQQDCEEAKLLEKDINILKQSIEFINVNKLNNEAEKLKISELATLYNLQGGKDKERSASLSIAQLIHHELKKNNKDDSLLKTLELFVKNPDAIRNLDEEKEYLINFFKRAINLTALQFDDSSSQLSSKGL